MFDNAYCASPLCVPSRMTMLTSRHCSDINVWTNACYLASDIPTFAHSLGAGGYDTILGGLGNDEIQGNNGLDYIVADAGSVTSACKNRSTSPVATAAPAFRPAARVHFAAVTT